MPEKDYRELEPLYDQAKKEIPLMPVISISSVQRVYRWGYNRAARLLEQLESAGVVSQDKITGKWRLPSTVDASHE